MHKAIPSAALTFKHSCEAHSLVTKPNNVQVCVVVEKELSKKCNILLQ